MNIKLSSPITLAIAIVVIAAAIFYVQSFKAQVSTNNNYNNYNPSLDADPQQNSLLQKAPELVGIDNYYINAPKGLKLTDLRGKVVLLDFWTYSCINCIRTLPYLEGWYEKYKNQGLVILGVHSPEFEFEKNYTNVQMAVEKFNLTYPVVLDNDHGTWNAYQNRYWPRHYLIDINGFIRYDHIGEGNYAEIEEEIQKLLIERNTSIEMGNLISPSISSPQVDNTKLGSSEIYLGHQFARTPLGNIEGFQNGQVVNYSLPNVTWTSLVYFNGSWKNNPDNMELVSDTGKVVLIFQAKNLNIVAGGNATLEILLDEVQLQQNSTGFDAQVVNNTATVHTGNERLYSLVNKDTYKPQKITIDVAGKGFKLYTFTFG
ncbi:MAG: redoxin domain-containing protein [Candidatus Micrarchaeota archaeon]|nr:redoxin domain-containing protein [Candidatus Micrarchaeota archaeon]